MKNLLGMILVLTFSYIPLSQAAIVEIDFMDVSAANVSAGFLPPGGFDLTVVSSDNLVGGYIAAITATPIGAGGIQTLYTAAFNQDPNGTGPAAGSFLGGPVPFGVIDTIAGTIQVNMSSMFSDHGPMDQNLGAIAMGTYDSLTGNYTMSWSSILTQGMNMGQVVTFTFSGNAAVIPVPAAVWLFFSGLIGLIAVAKKKAA